MRFFATIQNDGRVLFGASNIEPENTPDNYREITPEVYDGYMSAPERLPFYRLVGGEISFVPPAIDLKAYAAGKRWALEVGGAVWQGFPIHTDRESQGKYLAELQAISLDARIDGDLWKFADGVARPIANADFPSLAIAAREHVRQAFGIEFAVLASVEAGTVTTTAEVDAYFASAFQ